MKIGAFSKKYGEGFALEFPGAELANGKIYALLGANGSGKSTLARVISGWLKPEGGGAVISGARVGYLPQKSMGFRMSVKKNIMLGGKDEKRACGLMERLSLKDLEKARAGRLSGGECAKMCLARVLMGDYDLLVLDEPTAAMDVAGTLEAEGLIREYAADRQCPVILITHSLSQARRLADFTWYAEGGSINFNKNLTELEFFW